MNTDSSLLDIEVNDLEALRCRVLELESQLKIARQHEKKSYLLSALPDRMFVITKDGIFTEFYDNLPGTLSRVEENFEGYKIEDVYSNEIANLFLNQITEVLSSHNNGQIEYCEGEGLFERWFEVRSTLLSSSEVLFIVRETTLSRKSTQELLRAKERAEASDYLKSAFLANISHEIRTPLNAITGFSSLLAEDELDEDEKHAYKSIIDRNSEQLINLFADLLDISKIESGQLKIFQEPVNINEELLKLWQIFDQQMTQSNKGVVSLVMLTPSTETDTVIITDQTRFIQIFTNLLSNALKFTEKGRIEFGYKPMSKGRIHFFVKDSGLGIPLEEQEMVFDRFRQASTNEQKKHGGTGLGLAICKNLVEMQGGRIWLDSVPGRGATFNFTLPHKK